jgi:hypothetical protein
VPNMNSSYFCRDHLIRTSYANVLSSSTRNEILSTSKTLKVAGLLFDVSHSALIYHVLLLYDNDDDIYGADSLASVSASRAFDGAVLEVFPEILY